VLSRHERQTGILFRIGKFDCSLEKPQGLSMTIHLFEASAYQLQEPNLTTYIAASHRREEGAAKQPRGSSGISLKEGDQP